MIFSLCIVFVALTCVSSAEEKDGEEKALEDFGNVIEELPDDIVGKSVWNRNQAMLEKYKKGELDCEILKVGHHGSSTSTTAAFLAAVSPETAVISCGEGNTYGHPHKPTVERLEGADVKVYRTDIAGSIVIKVDGKSYSVVTEK